MDITAFKSCVNKPSSGLAQFAPPAIGVVDVFRAVGPREVGKTVFNHYTKEA